MCTYTEEFGPNGHFYVFSGPCIVTKKYYSVRVPGQALYNYRSGSAPIQDAFPDMPAGDREFLMSGISPEGWAKTFKEDK